MKMKVFEKTYVIALSLFLIFINLCIISLCVLTFNRNVESTQNACISEVSAVKNAYKSDMQGLDKDGLYLLQVSYGSFYSEKGIFLCFEENGKATLSTVPEGIALPALDTVSAEKQGEKHYMLIKQSIDNTLTLTYVKDVSYLYNEFTTLAFWYIGASAITTLVLAALLYLSLRNLYSPLEKLSSVTRSISGGDFSVRADERGNDEFGGLAKDFNLMSDKIREQIKALEDTAVQKQRMLDDLAHEMRTPLTGIHGYAEYIKTANISDKERIDATEYIMKEAMRLKSISEILLDTAFIRENKIEINDVPLYTVLTETKKRMEALPISVGVKIVCNADKSAVVQGNKLLIELLLSNLTENAIKACNGNGKVEIGVRQENDSAILYVKDNGVGMTKEQLEHVTEPLYRTDKARSRLLGGTGLGLALCDAIAKAHGTELCFTSTVGEGTEVKVKF